MAADPASLENLHDIIMPGPVPWWPPAPGWYVLGAVILIAVLSVSWHWQKKWRANAYRRAAIKELDRLDALAQDLTKRKAALGALPGLVKRVALTVYPRKKVAALSGSDWLEFLDQTGPSDAFTRGPGRLLPEIAYHPKVLDAIDASQTSELLQTVRHWVRNHSAQRATKQDG